MPTIGRFVSRDNSGYVDGSSLYAAYFVPDGTDPSGLRKYEWCCDSWSAYWEMKNYDDAHACAMDLYSKTSLYGWIGTGTNPFSGGGIGFTLAGAGLATKGGGSFRLGGLGFNRAGLGSAAALGGVVWEGGSALTVAAALIAYYNTCSEQYCAPSSNARQRLIDSGGGGLFSRCWYKWESYCASPNGVLVDSITHTKWPSDPGGPETSTYIVYY